MNEAKKNGSTVKISLIEDFETLTDLAEFLESAIREKITFESKSVNPDEKKLTTLISDALQEIAKNKTLMVRPHPSKQHMEFLSDRKTQSADEFARSMQSTIEELEREGHTTLEKIAKELNHRNIATSRGENKWHPGTVWHLKERIKNLNHQPGFYR